MQRRAPLSRRLFTSVDLFLPSLSNARRTKTLRLASQCLLPNPLGPWFSEAAFQWYSSSCKHCLYHPVDDS
jgi:hypothetical protein